MKYKKYETIEKYLIQFLSEEITKTGIKKAVVGLSGGIDSAVVAVLLQKAFGEDFLAVLMPSQYSSQSSIDDAKELCEVFAMRYEVVSIAPMLLSYLNDSDQMSRLRIGNFSARLRMSVLYDISAREGALVVGTSNKSEIMLGYGTLFGDLASALNPLGDMYKSEVFEFAEYLNVTDAIATKAPSADLWEGQSDESELGYTYQQIDTVLKLMIDQRYSCDDLIQKGHEVKLVQMLHKRLFANHFKRVMPIIAKLTSRSVGSDFLYARDILL